MSKDSKSELAEISASVLQAYRKEELRLVDHDIAKGAFDDILDVEFLSQVGVPMIEEFAISFNLIDRMPSLRDLLGKEASYSPNWPKDIRCINLKDKEDAVYGIDKTREDAVVCLDLSSECPVTFVSTKLRYFVGFFAECRLHLIRIRSGAATKEQSFELSQNRMRQWDPKAVNQGWWQGVFETVNFYE